MCRADAFQLAVADSFPGTRGCPVVRPTALEIYFPSLSPVLAAFCLCDLGRVNSQDKYIGSIFACVKEYFKTFLYIESDS